MKVKALSRSSDDYLPTRRGDHAQRPRNLDPELHPFERAREYTRALNSVKLERMFAAPFVGQMGRGHVDGVYCLAKNPRNLVSFASGSGDGELKVWDVGEREQVFTVKAHDSMIKGLSYTADGNILSCSSDTTVKLWNVNENTPQKTFLSAEGITSISAHRHDPRFAAASSEIAIYDLSRSQPVQKMSWDTESITTVRFNPTETSVLASAGLDRTLILYDTRSQSALTKLVTRMRTNAVSWNPMEAFNFAAASEDHNLYLYDMRRLDSALNVYKDHVGAVMDVDFSPTGQEIVSGSYDNTIRIWPLLQGRSRDVYHTTRMQRVFAVQYSMDSNWVLSGSDDGNVRLWRSNASSRAGVLKPRQQSQLAYAETLKAKYMHMPEIRRISRSRNIPKAIKAERDTKYLQDDRIKRKEENVRNNSRPGAVPYVAERRRHIVETKK